MNAKVGQDNTGRELIMGKKGIGDINENGKLFADFCCHNDLVIGGTTFPHKDIHNLEITRYENQKPNRPHQGSQEMEEKHARC